MKVKNQEKDIFLDASVLISILQKDLFLNPILEILVDYENLYISGFSYLFGYDKLRKQGFDSEQIHQKMSYFKIVYFDEDTIEKAKEICKDKDFEDALQIASAIENNIPNLLTNDIRQAKRYKNYLEIFKV